MKGLHKRKLLLESILKENHIERIIKKYKTNILKIIVPLRIFDQNQILKIYMAKRN